MSFTYGGPLATAAFVAGTFNDAQTNAKNYSSSSRDSFDQSSTYMDNFPGNPSSDVVALGAYTDLATRINNALAFDDRANTEFRAGLNARDVVSSTYLGPLKAFEDRLLTDMTNFYTTYFPNSLNACNSALAQMQDGIRFGGSTLKRSVSSLKWQAMVDGYLHKRMLDEKALIAKFAQKKFPSPPGALLRGLAAAAEETQRNIAEASSKLAMEQFDAEAAQTRSYIDLAQKNRTAAMDHFGQYLTKSVVLRYDQLTMEAQEQDNFRRALKELYFKDKLAEREAELWTRKLMQKEFDLSVAAYQDSEAYYRSQIEVLFNAALSQAERLSTIAATAFNIVRGGAALSSVESG